MKDDARKVTLLSSLILHPSSFSNSDRPAGPRIIIIIRYPTICFHPRMIASFMATTKFNWKELPPTHCRGGAVAFGNFDGVHRGHGTLLGELIRQAHALDVPAVAVTFDPHPLQL